MLTFNLKRSFPGFSLQASASIGPGCTALFGPSGAGKSTLLHLFAGLLQPDEGEISLAGRVLFSSAAKVNLPPERRDLGFVFQSPLLFPHLSVRKNLTYGLRRRKRRSNGLSFDDVVALLAIGHLLDRRPAHLSGGEGQRVALGRALLSAPRMLLLDEPFASLDKGLKEAILPYLDRMKKAAALPMIYVSHNWNEVRLLSDRVLLLNNGRLEDFGPPGESQAPDTANSI